MLKNLSKNDLSSISGGIRVKLCNLYENIHYFFIFNDGGTPIDSTFFNDEEEFNSACSFIEAKYHTVCPPCTLPYSDLIAMYKKHDGSYDLWLKKMSE